jgi:hypothetical protein
MCRTIPRHDLHLRASDAERDATGERLRAAAAEGRLDLEELEQRLEWTYAAKTRGQLLALTGDLPRYVDYAARARAEFARHLRSYLRTMAILTAIWAMTDLGGYYWPVWPAFFWGIAIACHWWGSAPQRRAAKPLQAKARAYTL